VNESVNKRKPNPITSAIASEVERLCELREKVEHLRELRRTLVVTKPKKKRGRKK